MCYQIAPAEYCMLKIYCCSAGLESVDGTTMLGKSLLGEELNISVVCTSGMLEPNTGDRI